MALLHSVVLIVSDVVWIRIVPIDFCDMSNKRKWGYDRTEVTSDA